MTEKRFTALHRDIDRDEGPPFSHSNLSISLYGAVSGADYDTTC